MEKVNTGGERFEIQSWNVSAVGGYGTVCFKRLFLLLPAIRRKPYVQFRKQLSLQNASANVCWFRLSAYVNRVNLLLKAKQKLCA